MSHPYAPAGSSTQPPPAQYTAQYSYQPQVPYAQYTYAQGYPPAAAVAYYQYYQHAQQPSSAYALPKPPLPTLSLSNNAPTASAQQQVAQSAVSTAVSQAATAPSVRGQKKTQTLKGTFNRELRSMLYAFGDVKEPANDTVDVLEEILMEYLVDVCHTGLSPSRKTRIQIEDLRRALGRYADGKKLARLEELLFMQDDIRRARKQFSTEEKELEEQAQVDL